MADAKWRKTLAISALMVSLLLISGSVYLHVKQKHHYGRLMHESKAIKFNSEEEKYIVTPVSVSEIGDDVTNVGEYVPHEGTSNGHYVSEACMQCICETSTECKPANCGPNQPCGNYLITFGYWQDGGKHIVEGDQTFLKNDDLRSEYQTCVNNAYCAARTVSSYIKKYARDCNHDGVIDCSDYIALHILGPTGCLVNEMNPLHQQRMYRCFDKYGM